MRGHAKRNIHMASDSEVSRNSSHQIYDDISTTTQPQRGERARDLTKQWRNLGGGVEMSMSFSVEATQRIYSIRLRDVLQFVGRALMNGFGNIRVVVSGVNLLSNRVDAQILLLYSRTLDPTSPCFD